jgi:hypothetical protein
MSRAVSALLVGLAVGAASSAHAWAPIASGSPVWRPPVPYSLSSAGSVDLGGFAATEPEVRRAMDDWTRVSCTSLTSNYRGSTSARPGTYEGTSVIGWIESGWSHGSSAIGVTGPRWGSNIIEADMQLNGVNFTWTTAPGRGSTVNTYSIVLHEGGHYYGLGHTSVAGSSMVPSYGGGVVGLGPDDENGICALYPGSGSDCTVTGCPSGQECVSGSCQGVVGDGTICAPCTDSSQCGGASDFCLGYPDGAGYCGRSCASDANCEGGRCVGTSGGNQCVRIVGGTPSCATSPGGCTRDTDCSSGQICRSGACVAQPTGGTAIGGGCSAGTDCNSGLCVGSVCTQSCDSLNPTGACPTGFYCDEDVSTCGNGYCLAGGVGAGAITESCSADTDCASLVCDRGTCSEACTPGGAVGCPAGFACQAGTLACQGACHRSGAPGDECIVNEDCTSSICATQGDRSFCTQLCDPATPCPDRFTCTPVGGETSVCIPDFGGLGSMCENNEECVSGICAAEADTTYCTRVCDDVTPCPTGTYECVATSDPMTRVCRPTAPTMAGGCGCVAAGSGGSMAPLALLALLALSLRFVVRRRR